MPSILKILIRIILAIFAIILILAILLEIAGGNAFKVPLTKMISTATGRDIVIAGDLDLHLLSLHPRIKMNDVKISNPDWVVEKAESNMASIGHFSASVQALPLLIGRVIVPSLVVRDADINLLREENGRANWIFGGEEKTDSEPTRLPVIKELSVTNSRLKLTDHKQKMIFSGTIESSESIENSSEEPFHLEGEGALNNKNFLMKISGDSLTNAKAGEPYPFNLDIDVGATKILAKGRIAKPFDLSELEAELDLKGGDLADLYYLTGLALPNTPAYAITGALVRQGNEFKFNGFKGKIGGSDIAGDLSVLTGGERPLLKAQLTSDSLDFKDLGTLFGAAPAQAVTADQKEKAAEERASARLLPDAPLQVNRVRSMDAEVSYRAKSVNAPNLPLKEVAVDVDLKAGILKLSPFSFILPQGRLSGNATIDATKDIPETDLDVRLSDAQLEQFFRAAKAEPAVTGKLLARIKAHGTGDSVRKTAATANGTVTIAIPHGEIRQAFAELLGINLAKGLGLYLTGDQTRTELRCSVISFKADNGLLTSQYFVFDTGVVLAQGTGTIDLKTERIDLAIQGQPKETSLTLHAPILVGGTLKKPSIGLSAEAIAQTGIAAVLGTVLTPLAAILPFLDEGSAEDANCGALLKRAKEKGTPGLEKK